MLETVAAAALSGNAIPAQGGASCEVWRGLLTLQSGREVRGYVKVGTRRQMFADVVGAQLARAVGLPVPQPFRVLATLEQLPGVKFWPWAAARGPIYGCAEIQGADTFARFVRRTGQAIPPLLLRWSELWRTTWFDEWVANSDRNLENILVVDRGKFWLIDHDQAFAGANWPLFPLEPDAQYANILFDCAAPDLTAATQHAARQAAQQCALDYARTVPPAIDPIGLMGDSEARDATDFLRHRAPRVPDLACLRLPEPQQKLTL